MKIEQAEARHTEGKCTFSRGMQGTRRGNADLAGGSKAHGEEMHILQAQARHTGRSADLAGGSKAHREEMQI